MYKQYHLLIIFISISQVAAHEKENPKKYNFFSWGCNFPCPVCNYPCYLLMDSLLTIPTNNRLLQLTYKERLHWAFGQEQKNVILSKDLQKINNKGNILAQNLFFCFFPTKTAYDYDMK